MLIHFTCSYSFNISICFCIHNLSILHIPTNFFRFRDFIAYSYSFHIAFLGRNRKRKRGEGRGNYRGRGEREEENTEREGGGREGGREIERERK